VRNLDRAMRTTPELPAPVGRWAGLRQREAQNDVNRRVGLLRLKRRTPDQQQELDKLNAGAPGHVPATTFTQGV
jgi:hypothetical protein